MIERCDDKKCKKYGEQYVDRGHGFPVCPSTPQYLSPIKMNSKFIGMFAGEPLVGIKQHITDIRL